MTVAQLKKRMDGRFTRVERRMNRRFTVVEGRLDSMESRIGTLDRRVESIGEKLDRMAGMLDGRLEHQEPRSTGCLVTAAIAAVSSAGSTGLGTCAWNPAASTRLRSSARA